MTGPQPVLILGAGINGAALARELVLNRIGVVLVDRADVASGATAYSSRLIHGGLRYLEYGDFALVRESLAERTRLLRLAPQYVRPLRLFIPVRSRLGGVAATTQRMLGRNRPSKSGRPADRGLWLVRAGLWFYDRYARDRTLPHHQAHRVGDPRAVAVDPQRYRWECAYSDAQVRYPERFTLALLEDARRLAAEQSIEFRVLTYHEARLKLNVAEIEPLAGADRPHHKHRLSPSAVINATGAWVDHTLRDLRIDGPRLIGGTKGSHLVTTQRRLVDALAGRGVYVEAEDGRPVFILPWGDAALIGTTDLPFMGDPTAAVADPDEINYLLGAVNEVLPQVGLTAADIDQHYSGVRPLPHADAATPGAVTRRHAIKDHPDAPLPFYSIVGGKLTTCRSLAEEAAAFVLALLGLPAVANSRERVLPGGEGHPADDEALSAEQQRLAMAVKASVDTVRAVWTLLGTRTEAVLGGLPGMLSDCLPGTFLPRALARHMIDHEWAATLDDLVERRLMLLYQRDLQRSCLRNLAEALAESGRLKQADIEPSVTRTVARLAAHYGKRVIDR